MKTSSRLTYRRLLLPHRGTLVLSLICAIGLAATHAAYAFVSGPLLALLLSGGAKLRWPLDSIALSVLPASTADGAASDGALAVVAVLLVCVALLKGLFQLGQAVFQARIVETVGAGLRARYFSHLLSLSLAEHQRLFAGRVWTGLTDDVTQVQRALVEAPIVLLKEGLAAIALLLAALLMSTRLALLVFVVLPLVGVVVSAIARRVKRAVAASQDQLDELGEGAHRALTSMREIKSNQREAHEGQKLARYAAASADHRVAAARSKAISPLFNEVVAALALGGTLIYAASLLQANALEPARLVSFFTAAILLYRPIKAIGNAVSALAAGRASVQRLSELFELPVEPPLSARLPQLKSTFECQQISVQKGNRRILDAVSLQLEQQRIVVVYGISGAGKSTLADVLSGLQKPDSGVLRWNNEALSPEQLHELRSQVALVPQQPRVLDGSLRENLTYGCGDGGQAIEDERMRDVLKAVGMLDRVSELDHGVEARVGRGGIALSAGEAQRVAVARALLRDASVLILDEPTAALDEVNGEQLIDMLRALRRRCAILVLTHDPAFRSLADRVFQLEDGRLNEVRERPLDLFSDS
jgi:subfamily B ATP-binding cassette protein MsbA